MAARLTRRQALASLSAALAAPAIATAAPDDAPPGPRPRHTDRQLTAVPNAEAIGRRYWSPGLDEGFVPQGLTVFGDEVLIAAYRSTDPKQNDGPARIFRMALADGRVLGSFTLPPAYGHPGGLAMAGDTLYVANSGRLLALALTADAAAEPKTTGEWRVDKTMGPSFLACDGDALWFGPFRNYGEPMLHRLPLARLKSLAGKPVNPAEADHAIPLPLSAQGATFDRQRRLWVSTSAGNRPGGLHRIDPADGAIPDSFSAPGGIEDLGCAPDGKLWAVGEAGSRRWNNWDTFFPLVFEIDMAKLKR